MLIVLGTLLMVIVLANIILGLISSQSRLTHHQVSRIKSSYLAQGMLNYANEMLRKGSWAANPASNATIKYACIDVDNDTLRDTDDCIDTIIPDYLIGYDQDIPYKVQIAINPKNATTNISTLNIETGYAYTP